MDPGRHDRIRPRATPRYRTPSTASDAVPARQYSIVFDDTNANNGNALQVWINGNQSNCVGSDPIASQNQFPIKVSVHNGLGSITLASSNTLQTGQTVTFSPDNSNGTYTIVAGGTGTGFTITPVFGGLTNRR